MHVSVQGGTKAGRKRPLRERAADWLCTGCKKAQPGYATRCLTAGCNKKRPR